MLTKDTELQDRWRQESANEAALERRQRMLAEELRNHEVTVESDAGFDITDLQAQMGKPMTCGEVMAKLSLCNSHLYFERAKVDSTKMGVYLEFPLDSPQGILYVNPQGILMRVQHLFGMEAGIMPEFTVIHKAKATVANQELFGRKEATREVAWKKVDTYRDQTRGWRTVLIRLLHAELITRGDVEKHFGWAPSRDSKRWHDMTSY